MRTGHISFAVLAIGGMLAGRAACAADAANPPPVVGSDVMGDKSRSGPDGWAWAPVTRDQSASASTPAAGEDGKKSQVPPNAQPAPNEGKTLPPGQDPGTPIASGSDSPAALQKPAASSQP